MMHKDVNSLSSKRNSEKNTLLRYNKATAWLLSHTCSIDKGLLFYNHVYVNIYTVQEMKQSLKSGLFTNTKIPVWARSELRALLSKHETALINDSVV